MTFHRNDTQKDILPMVDPITCPTNSGYYKLIDNACYYIERQGLKYRDAQFNCRHVFGLHGHLFEPKTINETITVYNAAKSKLGATSYWIGLDSIGRSGNEWEYSSTGEPKVVWFQLWNF